MLLASLHLETKVVKDRVLWDIQSKFSGLQGSKSFLD